MPEAPGPTQPRPFRRHFRNWLSWSGMVLAAAALFAFVLLFAIDFFAPVRILTLESWRMSSHRFSSFSASHSHFWARFAQTLTERRAEHVEEKHRILQIDLSRKRDRRILALFAVGSCWLSFSDCARQLRNVSIHRVGRFLW